MQDFKMIQRHLIVTILFSVILGANAFSYKDAKNWGKKYPKCNGKRQSPIILKHTMAKDFPGFNQGLWLTDFKKLPTKMTIKNTGHTVEIKPVWSGKPPKFSGATLIEDYVFEKTTFHWAQKGWPAEVSDDHESGGPSTIDMEMDYFFYRTDLKSFEKAQSQKEGLVIMRVLLTVSEPDSPVLVKMLDNLEQNLHKVQSPNSTAVITPFRLTSILDDYVRPLAFYEGSLDYPPCSESVTWFIDYSAHSVTKTLLNAFRNIKMVEGDVSNVRPYQASNNREIWKVYS